MTERPWGVQTALGSRIPVASVIQTLAVAEYLGFHHAAAKPRKSGVTDAHWQAEAARHGIPVDEVKSILGNDVYASKRGGVARCTVGAIREGLCGERGFLPVAKRAQLAQQALQAGSGCRWTRYDPAYHASMSGTLGASETTLWVKADCR